MCYHVSISPFGGWLIVSRQLYFTINLEEIFYFKNKNVPYLCGLWRFANAYLDELMRGEQITEAEKQVNGQKSIELKAGGLLQEWSNFLSNLSEIQKVKFTLLYIVVMLILCGILCVVSYVIGKDIGEAVYFITH